MLMTNTSQQSPLVTVAYHSGFGHTEVLAGAVAAGAEPEQGHSADEATCNHLGQRVAEVTRQLIAGRAATAAA